MPTNFQTGINKYADKLAIHKMKGVKEHPLVKLGRANIPLTNIAEKREGNNTQCYQEKVLIFVQTV